MFELAASPAQHVHLRERTVQQRLLLCDIEPGGGTQIVARGSELERASL